MILESEGRFVEIIILHRNNLESIDIEDANWLDAEIKINVPGFKGYYNANLRTDDFERFYKDLNKLKIDRFFQIEFTTMEEGIYLKGTQGLLGTIKWEGIARSYWGNSVLTFEIETGFASIDALIEQTLEILNEYPVQESEKLAELKKNEIEF